MAKLQALSTLREKPDDDSATESDGRVEAMLQEMEGRRQYRANVVADYLVGPRDAASLRATLDQIRH